MRHEEGVLGGHKKDKLTLHAVTDETGRPLHDPEEAGPRLCRHCGGLFQAQASAILEDHSEAMLLHVQPAPDGIMWEGKGSKRCWLPNVNRHLALTGWREAHTESRWSIGTLLPSSRPTTRLSWRTTAGWLSCQQDGLFPEVEQCRWRRTVDPCS